MVSTIFAAAPIKQTAIPLQAGMTLHIDDIILQVNQQQNSYSNVIQEVSTSRSVTCFLFGEKSDSAGKLYARSKNNLPCCNFLVVEQKNPGLTSGGRRTNKKCRIEFYTQASAFRLVDGGKLCLIWEENKFEKWEYDDWQRVKYA